MKNFDWKFLLQFLFYLLCAAAVFAYVGWRVLS